MSSIAATWHIKQAVQHRIEDARREVARNPSNQNVSKLNTLLEGQKAAKEDKK